MPLYTPKSRKTKPCGGNVKRSLESDILILASAAICGIWCCNVTIWCYQLLSAAIYQKLLSAAACCYLLCCFLLFFICCCWLLLVAAICCCLLWFVTVCCCSLLFAAACSSFLQFAALCWCLLLLAAICCSLLFCSALFFRSPALICPAVCVCSALLYTIDSALLFSALLCSADICWYYLFFFVAVHFILMPVAASCCKEWSNQADNSETWSRKVYSSRNQTKIKGQIKLISALSQGTDQDKAGKRVTF